MTRTTAPRLAAALASLLAATGLAACSDDDAGQVVITEVVTSTVGAPADATGITGTTGPDQSGSEPTIPDPRFRTVESDTFTMDGVHLLTSASGNVHCQLVDQSTGGFTEDIAGGCFTGPPTGEEGPMVMLSQWHGREGSGKFADERDGGYPGFFFGPGPSLEPGTMIHLRSLTCFSPDDDGLGCVDLRTGQGFQLIGTEVTTFGQSDWPEIFDSGGVTQTVAPYVRYELDAGHIICTDQMSPETMACGNTTGFDWDGDNAVSFDLRGDNPVASDTRVAEFGYIVDTSQSVGVGEVLHGDLLAVNDGEKVTFHRPNGTSFHAGPAGPGVN